jgi:hypothetical protein
MIMIIEGPSGEITVRGIKFPERIATFERVGQVTNNEIGAKGLGFTIAYGRTSLGKATIFVYDKGIPDIPDGPDGLLVLREFNLATEDVFNSPRLLSDRSFELVGRYGTGAPERGREFLCAEFLEHTQKGTARSFLYLTGAKGHS